jgi:hypothetical protein
MDRKRIILRVLYAVIFLVISIFFLYSLSRLLVYFNTGAGDNIYYLSEEIFDAPNSTVEWLEDDDYIKGEINKYVRSDIGKAYARAWHIRDLSIYHQKDLGLIEHFSDPLKEKIMNAYTDLGNDTIHSKKLTHNLKLHLISYDKQVVSFSDIDSHQLSIVYNNNRQDTINSIRSYNVVMTLDDGVWRIRQLKQL